MQIDRDQRVGRRREPQCRSRARELDDERPALDCRDAADAELRIEAMGEVIPPDPVAHPSCRNRSANRA
jgi:hypothetical protein